MSLPGGRIMIYRGGRLAPRVEGEPLISGANNKWPDLCLEKHHLQGPSDSKGVIEGFQICCNLSGPVPAEWLVHGIWRNATLNKGDLCLATHGEFRSVAWGKSYDLLLLSVSPQLMAEASGHEGQVSRIALVDKRAFHDGNVENLCRLLLADTAAGTPVGPLYGEHLANSLATYLAGRYAEARMQRPTTSTSLPGPVLKRVCELIETRLNAPLGLEDLAREANMSRFHFARLFRNSTGDTPHRYLTRRRIERAKEMLGRGMCEEDVAISSGFSSRSHFGWLFRKYAGVTPRKFRSLFP